MKESRRDFWWSTAVHSAGLTFFYVLSGLLWVQAQPEREYLDVVQGILLLSTFLVFPSSLLGGAGLFLLAPGRRGPTWRSITAGVIAAPVLFSKIGEGLVKRMESMGPALPAPLQGPAVFLLPLSVIPMVITASQLLTWALPPWRSGRVPEGGGLRCELPAGGN